MSEGRTYKELFAQTLYEEMLRVFGEHGIDVISEDELEDIAKECFGKAFFQSINELHRQMSRSRPTKPVTWAPGTSRFAMKGE